MERTSKTYTLPVTKYQVGIYDYYLRGDRVAIEKIMTDAVEVDKDGKFTSVKTSYRYDMEDEAVVRGVAYIKSEKGVDIAVGKDGVRIEVIRELPEEDYEFIKSKLPKQDEKNLTTKPSADISVKPQKSGE